jgi:hypothetical protein
MWLFVARPTSGPHAPLPAAYLLRATVLDFKGRSGSTFVASLLGSHPAMLMGSGEPFNQHHAAGKAVYISPPCPGKGARQPRATFCTALREAGKGHAPPLARACAFFAALRSLPSAYTCGKTVAVVGVKVLYGQLWASGEESGNPCVQTQRRSGNTAATAYSAACPRRLALHPPATIVDAAAIPTPVATAGAAVGARAIVLVRENRLAHYMALRSAALGNQLGLRLHCGAGSKCAASGGGELVHIPVISLNSSSRCASVCDSMPLAFAPALRYYTFPWGDTTRQGSPLHCATLHDFIDISIREDALTTSLLRHKGIAVHVVTYESLLPKRGDENAICTMLDFVGLPCRDARGALLVRAGTQRMHAEQPANVVSNYAEVSAYLLGRNMGWMLDF